MDSVTKEDMKTQSGGAADPSPSVDKSNTEPVPQSKNAKNKQKKNRRKNRKQGKQAQSETVMTTEKPGPDAISENQLKTAATGLPLDSADSPKLCTYDVEEIPVDESIMPNVPSDLDVQPPQPRVNTFFNNEDGSESGQGKQGTKP